MGRIIRVLSDGVVVVSMLIVALVWTCGSLMTLFGLFVAQRFRKDDAAGAVVVRNVREVGR